MVFPPSQDLEATLRYADLSFETSDLTESDSQIPFRNRDADLIDQISRSKYQSRLSQFNFSLFGFRFRVSKVAENLPGEPGESRLDMLPVSILEMRQFIALWRCSAGHSPDCEREFTPEGDVALSTGGIDHP